MIFVIFFVKIILFSFSDTFTSPPEGFT